MNFIIKVLLQIVFFHFFIGYIPAFAAKKSHLDSIAEKKQQNRSLAFKRISEIRFENLSQVSQHDLESVLPFTQGDIWREDLVDRSIKILTEYYIKRGFYHAKLSVYPFPASRDDRVVMIVKVEEGAPCVLSSIWIDDPPGFTSKHVMLRFKSNMYDVLGMKEGDRYDEQVLIDRVRSLREWLALKNFIVANTDKIRLRFNSDQTKVDLTLVVDYGDRVTFGFRGNSLYTKGELNEFIDQLRATGMGKDYVGIIQRKFIDEYRSRGFNDVQVKSVFSSPLNQQNLFRHLTFFIDEGARTELEEVKWEGLSAENIQVAKDALEKQSSRLLQRGFYVEKDFEKTLQVLLEDLKARGYLSSKVISKNVQQLKVPKSADLTGKKKRVRVLVQISEGEQTVINQIFLDGFHYFSSDKVQSILNVKEQSPFNPFAFEDGLQKLRQFYLSEGFLDYKLLSTDENLVNFSENNRIANIHLSVHEGLRIKVGDIKILGLQKTRPYVVERELILNTNDFWIASQIQEMETNLRGLGIFSDVKIVSSVSKRGSEYRDLIVNLQEVDPGAIEAGPGFRSDLGIRAFARVSYNNILGRNWIASLGAESNRRLTDQYRFIEYNFNAAFIEPRFFDTHLIYTVGLSTKKQRFVSDFNAVTTQAFTSFEHKFFKKLSTKFTYKYERIRQFDVSIADDNRSILIGSLVPAITFDSRDNPFTPTAGVLASLSLEYAHPHASGQSLLDSGASAYQKWVASIHKYTLLPKDITWSNVISAGFARSNIAGRDIPLIKLFRLGGYSTIRGFAEDSLNVDTIRILGTLSFINFRTQFDIPLVGDLKIAPFLDAGNLFIDAFRARPFLRTGAGVGLHYNTPIGPINLDWGHKLYQLDSESPNQFHFSVGLI